MGKRDELIAIYARDLREKCGVEPDLDLLGKVCKGLGPALYKDDSTLVAASDPEELDRIKARFLVKKLGLPDGPDLMPGIDKAIDTYGRSNRSKHRAVVYYLLAVHFGRQAAYG